MVSKSADGIIIKEFEETENNELSVLPTPVTNVYVNKSPVSRSVVDRFPTTLFAALFSSIVYADNCKSVGAFD